MDIFSFLVTRPMGFIIELIYSLIPNYGVAIILFTIVIKVIIFPLTYKSQKSMVKQQRVAPLVAEIQAKYANDKEKQSVETMKIYKENNVSMAGGCLPMLLQLPLIMGLYRVVMKPLTYIRSINFDTPQALDSVKVIQNSFPDAFSNATAQQIIDNSQIALSKAGDALVANPELIKMLPDVSVSAQQVIDLAKGFAIDFNFMGIDLSRVPNEITALFSGGTIDWSLLLFLIVPVAATVLTWLQSKLQTNMTAKKQGKKDEEPKPKKRYTGKEEPKNTSQSMTKTMSIMFPAMTLIFTFTMPQGVGLYWVTSSVVQIAQQYLLNNYLNKKEGDIVVKQLEDKKGNKKRKKR